MEIQQIKHMYDKPRTYENARSKLKRVNALLNLEPAEVIHTDQYVTHFDKITHLLMTQPGVNGGIVKSKDELTSLIGAISGAVSRTLPFDKENPLAKLIIKLKQSDVPNTKPVVNIESWESVLEKLNKVITDNPSTYAKIVAVCYKHGYVLRISEIFDTATTKTDTYNHLDLDNLIWRIFSHKGTREFTVTKEFVNELRPLLSDRCPLLIFKSTFRPYSIHTHSVVNLDELPSNPEIRNSYQEWNWYKSGRTYEQQKHWATAIMGHSEMTILAYINPLEYEKLRQKLNAPPEPSIKEQIANWKPGDPKIKVKITKKTKPSTL